MTQITAAKTKRENAPFQLGSFLKTKTLLADWHRSSAKTEAFTQHSDNLVIYAKFFFSSPNNLSR